MAFIAGYVSPRPRYATAELLDRLRNFAILPGEMPDAYEQTVVTTPHGHLMVKHKPTYPVPPRLVTDIARNALATLGFVLTPSGTAEPKDLLASCTASGAGTLTEREGEFVAIFADAASGAVHVVNDRFAARPCYVLRNDGEVYFSSNVAFLLHLARVRYRPDVVGWLEAFSYAHTNGARTTVDGVERLRPATHVTITPSAVTKRQYWRLEHRPDRGLDPARHSAEVFDAFRHSAGQRARLFGKGVLALSGGLDSRLVAAAVPRDTDFETFTFVDAPGVSRTAQTDAAAAVCAALGLRHRIETLPRHFTRPADVISLTGGMRPYHHMAIVMAYVAEILRKNVKCLLGGGPGDVLAGSYIPSPDYLDPARIDRCIADAYQRRIARSQYWPLVFRDDVIASKRGAVEQALAESFAAAPGSTAAHRITAWGMTCRQPAFTFTSLFHTHPDVTEAVSHLGYRYSDLMLQLPAEWLYARSFYSYMVFTELPQLRHVPYANTGALLTGHAPSFVRPQPLRTRVRQLAERLGARRAKRLVTALLRQRPPARRWLVLDDETLLAEVRETIHSVQSLGDVLDIRRCDEFLDNVRAGHYTSNAHEEVLGGLTSMCASATTLVTSA
jgi:Asparagine synthase